MENKLFRQKSIERISSPEALHDYMRVTSPRLWMILGAILVLLAGFVVYASTAKLENTVPIRVKAESPAAEAGAAGQTVSGTAPLSLKDTVAAGMAVRIGEEKGKVSLVAETGGNGAEDAALYLVITLDRPGATLPDGEYDAELVLESTTPISFLWN